MTDLHAKRVFKGDGCFLIVPSGQEVPENLESMLNLKIIGTEENVMFKKGGKNHA